MKGSPRHLLGTWQCPHHHVGTGGEIHEHIAADGAEASPDQVAGYRVAHGFRHDKAETARLRAGPFHDVQHCTGRTDPATASYRSAEVDGKGYPVRPGEHAKVLRGQLGATLATTSGKDGAARAGAHAEAETVNLCAAAVVRLESSLAHSGISKAQL